MQLAARRMYARHRGGKVVLEVEEVGSGASERPQREELLQAARRRALDVIVVWRLDRGGRSVVDRIATRQASSR